MGRGVGEGDLGEWGTVGPKVPSTWNSLRADGGSHDDGGSNDDDRPQLNSCTTEILRSYIVYSCAHLNSAAVRTTTTMDTKDDLEKSENAGVRALSRRRSPVKA